MLSFTKKLTTAVARHLVMKRPLLVQMPAFYFCSSNNAMNPVLAKIKEAYVSKGHKSKEYQQEMSKAMRDALSKYDHDAAINLELFHLSLIKESEGEKSETYTSQLREISKFCINRLHFDTAAKLIEELRRIEESIEGVNPLDLVSTYYLQGYVFMELEKYEESKKCFNKCLQMKQVSETPDVFFKVFSEMARVHARCGENEQSYKKLAKCEQILKSRQYSPESPPMIMVMDLQDVFHMAEICSSMNDKAGSDKYMNMYKEKLDKVSNSKDPMYVEYLERKAKIHFNLKQFAEAVKGLREAAGMSEELSKVDPNFKQNVNIMNGIADSIEKEYLKK